MLYEKTTTKSPEQIDTALREAAARHKFGVLYMHDLQAAMQGKGVDFSKLCRVYEVCNPFEAKQVLETNGAVSTALPCRISVYEAEEGLRVSTILPTAFMAAFGNPELETVARRVEEAIVAIINETA
jgi:uncharacterized protein (DUF302 family)